jgi:hypothetical protein
MARCTRKTARLAGGLTRTYCPALAERAPASPPYQDPAACGVLSSLQAIVVSVNGSR